MGWRTPDPVAVDSVSRMLVEGQLQHEWSRCITEHILICRRGRLPTSVTPELPV